MQSPFKFLDAYTLEDKDVFFGRDKEVEELYDAVNKNRLVLVYGQSGTGKTSLVQCGLASRFDATDWYPLFIRRQDDINRALRQTLEKAAKRKLEGSLTDSLQRLNARFLRPIYLLFDQLEELLILGSREEQQAFIQSLREILNAEELSCHVILILREEYIAHLYPFEQAISTLFDRRLRVEPMTNTRVREVLRSSFTAFDISLEAPEENITQIIENVSAGRSGIQLPYLQVYLDMLWRSAADGGRQTAADGPPSDKDVHITSQQITELGRIEEVLEKFLQEQEVVLQREMERQYPGFPEQGVRQVLDAFVTAEGTKRPVGFHREGPNIILEEKVAKLLPSAEEPGESEPSAVHRPPSALTSCLEALETRRLLRFADDSIELAHDSLADLIDKRRTDEQRQLNEVKVRLAGSYLEWQRTGEFLTRKQLLSIEPFLERLVLEPHLEQFVQESYAYNKAAEEEERQKQQAELEKERRLRGEAEQNEKRARQRTRVAAFISLVAVLLAVFAFYYWQQAKTAESNAKVAQDQAEESAADAIASAKAARDAEARALASQDSTESALYLADSLGDKAEIAASNARRALADLQAATAQLLDSTLSDAQRDILALEYESARVKYQNAAQLNIESEKVGEALMELAFFRTEAGQYESAWALTEQTAGLYGQRFRKPAGGPQDERQALRDILKRLDADRYQELERRYFPEMLDVLGGTLPMGCDSVKLREIYGADSGCPESELPRHEVKLSNFRIARTETTVWQYYLFTEATKYEMPQPPSWQWEGNNPIVRVSWYDILAYANWLSQHSGLGSVYQLAIPGNPNDLYGKEDSIDWKASVSWAANGFRLPTEAEWEYAARGGQQSKGYLFSGSDEADEVAWWDDNASSRTQPVARKKANELGLYDMSGNVREWCWDWYGLGYYSDPEASVNPRGPENGSYRVLRGGSWVDYTLILRSSNRSRYFPSDRINYYGFRLAQGY